LTATLGDETGFKARDGTLSVGLDLANPHAIDDHAAGGEIDEFTRAVH
jgi:hypothetical protein